MTAIDETDQRILTMLEADGRATLAQLAQATGLSVSAAQSRVQKLEKRGIIKGYKAIIDQEQRGLPISAFVNVTPLDYSAESSIPDKLNNIDGIVSCYSVAGAPGNLRAEDLRPHTPQTPQVTKTIRLHGPATPHKPHRPHDPQQTHLTSPKSVFMPTI